MSSARPKCPLSVVAGPLLTCVVHAVFPSLYARLSQRGHRLDFSSAAIKRRKKMLAQKCCSTRSSLLSGRAYVDDDRSLRHQCSSPPSETAYKDELTNNRRPAVLTDCRSRRQHRRITCRIASQARTPRAIGPDSDPTDGSGTPRPIHPAAASEQPPPTEGASALDDGSKFEPVSKGDPDGQALCFRSSGLGEGVKQTSRALVPSLPRYPLIVHLGLQRHSPRSP